MYLRAVPNSKKNSKSGLSGFVSKSDDYIQYKSINILYLIWFKIDVSETVVYSFVFKVLIFILIFVTLRKYH